MADYVPYEAPAHDASSLPVSMPLRLIGRDMVLAKVYSSLKDRMAVHIYGPEGIGKTALAATLASAYTDLPSGVLWFDVTQDTTLAELIARVGRAYRVSEIGASENPLGMVGAAAATLTGANPLIVLDGKLDEQAARDFITRCADRLPVLLIADEQMVGPWTAVEIEKLAPEQAALMFKQLSGHDKPDGEENDADIDRLVQAVDYVPFGVAVAAGAVRANKQTPAEFLKNLPQQSGVSGSILALTASFRGLNSALQGLLLVMGASLGGEASSELLSLVSGVPQENLKQAMLMLSHRQLAERFTRHGQPYYRLHPLTYTFTQPLLRGSGKLDSLRQKFHDSVLSYTSSHLSDSDADYDRLATEMDTLLSLARWSSAQGDRETAGQIVSDLTQAGAFVDERGYAYELRALRRLAASAPTSDAVPTRAVEAAPEPEDDDIVDAQPIGGTDAPAPAAEETDTAAPTTTPIPPLSVPTNPLPFEDQGETSDSEDEAEVETPEADAQPTFSPPDGSDDQDDGDDGDDPLVRMAAQASIGEDADTENTAPPPQEPAEITRLRASLVQARQQGNLNRQAELQTQIGQAYQRANMDNEAIASFAEALTTYEGLNDPSGTLATLETLARLANRTDNVQAGVMYATRGAQLALDAKDPARQARMLSLLGDARQQLGESEQAASAYRLALDLAQTLQDQEAEAMLLLKLGYAQLDGSQTQAAVATWEKALPLLREQNKRDLEGRVLGGLGTAYGELDRWIEAIGFHDKALSIAREVEDQEEEALQLTNLGYASVQANQLGQAVLRYRQALHVAYETGNRDNIVSTIVDLAQLLVESQRHTAIAELLINDAIKLDPNDRDVKRLKERIEDEKQAAVENGIQLIPVAGTAHDYAANAYQLLDT